MQNGLLKKGQAVPDEITTRLTAVESRLATREQSQLSAAAAGQGDTASSYNDKVVNSYC